MAINQALLAQASRSHVLAALAMVKGAKSDDWLASGHSVRRGELPPNWNVVGTMPPQHLIDAVAIAIPTHCVDGWSFAARAFNALLAGDAHACRHMAYYAQLRAGLCILANLGVGLFNGMNFIVDAGGAIIRIDPPTKVPPPSGALKKGMGTHEVVWAALDQWSKHPVQSQTFLDMIKVRHTSLRDVLDILWPGFISTATVGGLINAWAVDLKRGQVDRGFRNTSSYAGHALNPLAMRTGTNLRFIENVWRLFEPSGSASFDKLDRHLLRRILLAQHESVSPGSSPDTGAIDSQYANLPASIRAFCARDFLLNRAETTQLEVIRYADANSTPAPPLQMLSRALLLLRTAMAFTHSSLTDAGVNTANGDLHDWLEEVSLARGFSGAQAPLGNGTGLWDDILVAMDDLKRSRLPIPIDLMRWKTANSNGMPLMSEAERIAVWSLCA